MTALAIDTLKLARRLRETAGFTPEHAEAAAEAFADAVAGTALVTNDHLDLKLSELRSEIRAAEARLETSIARLDAKIDTSAANTKSEILRWMFGAMAAQTALIVGLVKLIH
ncbi:MAG: hypothetical protein WCF85_19515 [Rhodospirillaceae bacterium]